jgi:hypothetical protein
MHSISGRSLVVGVTVINFLWKLRKVGNALN